MTSSIFTAKYRFWIFLFIYGMGMQISLAQSPISFTHLTIENGLSSNSVLSIAQDQKGFIWAGTMDGLNRYDGRKIKVYKGFYRDNPIGPAIKVNKLLADKKNNLWIGTSNGLYLYNNQADSFRVFYHSAHQRTGIADNVINELYLDKQENIWIGTRKGLTKLIVNNAGFTFETISLGNKDSVFKPMEVQAVFETSRGQLLVGTTKGLICIQNPSPGQHKKSDIKISLPDVHITSICEDKTNNIWIGTDGQGVCRVDQENKLVEKIVHSPSYNNGLVSNIIRKIFTDRFGKIWIGTLKGLNIYDPATKQFQVYQHDPAGKGTLNFNSIYDIFEDRQGNVWIGTFFGGLNIAESFTTAFSVYRNEGKEHAVSSDAIGPILADKQNNLWVGTEAEGLNYFDRKSLSFKHFRGGEPGKEFLTSNLVKTLAYDPYDRLWVGMHGGGINILDRKGQVLKRLNKADGAFTINSNDVIALLPDHNNRMWIGTEKDGISIYDFNTGKALDFSMLYPGLVIPSKAITCLFEDSKQNIWIGTMQGLSRLQADGKKIINYLKSNQPYQLRSDYINCIVEDKKGVIWVGTYVGLSYYNPLGKGFSNYTVENGLAGNKVVGVIADDQNNLWISTNNGLSRFDTGTKHFNNFNVLDGLPGNVFNYKSFSRVGDGHLYFGGFAGLVEFLPWQIQLNAVAPSIILTGLSVNGKPVRTRDRWGILHKDISATKKVEMKYNQNLLSIDYAVMNFIKADKNRSAYKLEGYDADWVYTDGQTASFTNLLPGNYRLLIKACNNDGVWNNKPISLWITILPPPWKTWWAYALYALGMGVLIFGVVYFFVSRTAMRRQLRYEHLVNTKQQELHQMKIDFFTHISHEIRTPLTLIMGPVEVLEDIISPGSAASRLLQNIKNNAERMLKLTTDLLEFRKSDSGYTQLKISRVNVVLFSRQVFEKFTDLAQEKQIDFSFNCAEKNIPIYLDSHYMEIVLTNLLSNAIKFAPKGGKVSISLIQNKDETIDIITCDNGLGISQESHEKIFTSFYQADGVDEKHVGSGIGLAFSKNLVELHGGKLYFRCGVNADTQERETCFIINLQCGLRHFNDSSLIDEKNLNNVL